MTAGTNPVGAYTETVSTGGGAMTTTAWFAQADANSAVAQRVADSFAPRPSATPAMTVAIDAGFLAQIAPGGQQAVTEIATQTVTVTTAPGSPNNRIDLVVVDAASGAGSVIAGTPATTPAAPALPTGKLQVATVSVPNGTAAIGNSLITDVRAVWTGVAPGVPWVVAGGTADALTATVAALPATIPDGYMVALRAAAGNQTTAPTFAPNGGAARTLTKLGGVALLPGDIAGSLAESLLRYDVANTRWELLNPATTAPIWGIAGGTSDALTLAPSSAVPVLYDGLLVTVRNNGSANTTTTPTANVSGLGAKTIVKFAGAALAVGDLAGGGAELLLRYNAGGSGTWAYVNAPSSTGVTSSQITTALGYTPAPVPQIGGFTGITAVGGNTTLTTANDGQMIVCNGSGTYAVTLRAPNLATAGTRAVKLWVPGEATVSVKVAGSGTISSMGGATAAVSETSFIVAASYGGEGLFIDGGTTWYLTGFWAGAAPGSIPGGGGGGGEGGGGPSCFLGHALVSMMDGTQRRLDTIVAGEVVMDAWGQPAPVLATERVLLGDRLMFVLNSDHWTTDEHPHWTTRGPMALCPESLLEDWGHTHPVRLRDGSIEHWLNVGLTMPVERLTVGAVLLRHGEPELLRTIDPVALDRRTVLHNLVLGGSHTYRVGGIAVTGWPREDDFDYATRRPRAPATA